MVRAKAGQPALDVRNDVPSTKTDQIVVNLVVMNGPAVTACGTSTSRCDSGTTIDNGVLLETNKQQGLSPLYGEKLTGTVSIKVITHLRELTATDAATMIGDVHSPFFWENPENDSSGLPPLTVAPIIT